MPTHIIDANRQAPFEIGAGLMILLCYHDRSDENRRRLANAMCANIVSALASSAADPTEARAIRSRYSMYNKADNRTSLGTYGKRLQDAQHAGAGLLPLIKYQATGQLPLIDETPRSITRRYVVEYYSSTKEDNLEIDFDQKIHQDTKHRYRRWDSVVHLASAFVYAARASANAAPEVSVGIMFGINDLDFIRELVVRANRHAEYIRNTPGLEAVAGKLITIEWRE